jgi:hypothetical protein
MVPHHEEPLHRFFLRGNTAYMYFKMCLTVVLLLFFRLGGGVLLFFNVGFTRKGKCWLPVRVSGAVDYLGLEAIWTSIVFLKTIIFC